jgi:hypothetical protein
MSYCYWTEARDLVWHRVEQPDPKLVSTKDGSDEFLALLLEPSASYLEFANWYYERSLPAAAVEAIYRHASLTPTLVAELNPEASGNKSVPTQPRSVIRCRRAMPNPSLKLTRYGMQRKPGVRRLRHLRTPGLHCTPPRAA